MQYEQAQDLQPQEFKRLYGVQPQTFKQMVEVMREHTQHKKKSGCPKLSLEDQVLVALQYWREDRTYFHIAQDWQVSESTVCRVVHKVETILIRSGKFRLAGKKSLLLGPVLATVAIDVTESTIERPKRRQKQFYSGKKKRHTFKSQLVIDLSTGTIICTAHGKGKQHDFRLFQTSRVRFHHQSESLADKGYQGIHKFHALSQTPKKKPRGRQLSIADKRYNRELAKRRVMAEHVNRHLKIFKILGERYRNRDRRFGLRCNLIAALYNYELGLVQ